MAINIGDKIYASTLNGIDEYVAGVIELGFFPDSVVYRYIYFVSNNSSNCSVQLYDGSSDWHSVNAGSGGYRWEYWTASGNRFGKISRYESGSWVVKLVEDQALVDWKVHARTRHGRGYATVGNKLKIYGTNTTAWSTSERLSSGVSVGTEITASLVNAGRVSTE